MADAIERAERWLAYVDDSTGSDDQAAASVIRGLVRALTARRAEVRLLRDELHRLGPPEPDRKDRHDEHEVDDGG